MEPLTRMADSGATPVLSRRDMRCRGLCQEEQVELQLEAHGVALAPLPVAAALVRLDCAAASSMRPLLALVGSQSGGPRASKVARPESQSKHRQNGTLLTSVERDGREPNWGEISPGWNRPCRACAR